MPSSGPSCLMASIMAARPPSAAGCPAAPRVFLELHQRLRALGPGLRLLQRPRELRDLLLQRVDRRRLPSALLRRERVQLPALARTSPLREVGRVQALAPQQRALLARLRAGVGLLEDAQL